MLLPDGVDEHAGVENDHAPVGSCAALSSRRSAAGSCGTGIGAAARVAATAALRPSSCDASRSIASLKMVSMEALERAATRHLLVAAFIEHDLYVMV
jgi:hypothetical protein